MFAMPKRAPPESAVDATMYFIVRKRASETIGSDTETSVFRLGYPCKEINDLA